MAGFGLSAFVFSSISHILFPGNTSDFLLVLTLGTSLPMVLGFFFVRLIPLPTHGINSVEDGSPKDYQPLSVSADADETPHRMHRISSSAPLLFHAERDDEEETQDPVSQYAMQRPTSKAHLPVLDSMELSPSTSFRNCSRSGTMSLPAQESPVEKIAEGRGVDLYRWTLWKSTDFWIMCLCHSLCRFLFCLMIFTAMMTPLSGWYRTNV
jgi:hypothetical protein